MLDRLQGKKVLIYSHDSFGLGHLRRCRAIAHSLVDAYKGLSVMILSGSPMISQFDFKSRVSFICVPGIVKLRNGDYTPLGDHIDLGETLALRASMIQHTTEVFSPDIFIVDKEPLGLRGEVEPALKWLKLKGVPNVLGLRDVMDDMSALQDEWERKMAIPALDNLYDEIWVYGTERTGNPISGIAISAESEQKMHYVGYLRRQLPGQPPSTGATKPYILITPGGGGDGDILVDWVIRAYESDALHQLPDGVIVVGPFMPQSLQTRFRRRAAVLPHLTIKIFDNQIEHLMVGADGIVAMGGYNTFCELLSFNKRAVIVPRETPRMEQRIRANFAASHGLCRLLPHDESSDTGKMHAALLALPHQPLPARSDLTNLLHGLDNIHLRLEQLLTSR